MVGVPADSVERLGHYVYTLSDPRNGAVFYVGRGHGMRALQHRRDALASSGPCDRLDMIRAIHADGQEPVAHLIRHGIGADVAEQIEAALIDFSTLCNLELTNRMRGSGTIQGIRRLDALLAELAAPPLSLTEPAVAVLINRLWREDMTAVELWEAAQGYWRCDPGAREPEPRVLLAVASGIVRGAWEIVGWTRKPIDWDGLPPNRQEILRPGRYDGKKKLCTFDAGGVMRPEYVGRRLDEGRSYGASHLYINCSPRR